MHYNQSFAVIICFLIAVATSHGMESENKFGLYKIEEITSVRFPRRIKYITNNTIAINGLGCFSLVDLETKAILCIHKRDNNREYVNFPMLYSNDKIIISSADEKLVIYDEQRNVKTSFTPRQNPIWGLAVHQSSDTVFLASPQRKVLTKYSYVTKVSTDIIIPGESFSLIDIHPKKDIMCIVRYAGTLSFHTLDNLKEPFKTITFVRPIIYLFCQYSLDGSYIAAGHNKIVHVIDPDKHTYYSLKPFKNERFNTIAFHPDGLTLATVATRKVSKVDVKAVIHYWDLQTEKCIYTMSELGAGYGHDLSFSPDGLEVIVALNDKCIKTLVPFVGNKKGKEILFWLNQLKEQKKIPQDIVKHSLDAFLRYLSF